VSDLAANTAAINALVAEMQKKAQKEAADEGSTGSSSRLGGGSGYMSPDQLQARLKIERELVTSERDRLDVEQQLAKIEYDRALQWESAFKSTLEEGVELTAEQAKMWEEISFTTEVAEQKLKKLTKAQKELNVEQAKGTQGAKTLKNNLFGLSGGLSKILEIVPTTGEAFKSFSKEMFNWSSIQEMATGGMLKIFDLFMQVAFAADEAQAKFRQNTGAGKEFNNNLSAVRNNLQAAGVGFDEAGKSLESLYGGMSSFTRESDGMQTKLASTVAVYDQLGVSMDVTTGIMDQAVLSLGYDAQGSMDLVNQLKDTAISLGKNISDVFADFASASKKLSFYGTDMINVFRKLEMQSKDTGLSIDEILGLTEQFDTFEGAGKAVGKLNALLGGPYLNSIDMLNATEAERMDMMKEAVDMSGVIFSDLSKYEQKAFAAALGTDVDTLRRSMGALTAKEEEQIKVQQEAEERAKAAKSAMEGLTLQLQALIQANKPLMNQILELIRRFTEWIAATTEGRDIAADFKKILWGLAAVKFVGFAVSLVSAMTKIKTALSLLKWTWIKSLATMVASWVSANTAFAVTPIGAIITAVVAGIVLLVWHFKKMKEAGLSTSQAFMDIGQKILVFMGPVGLLISGIISLVKHLANGKSLAEAFGHAILDLANNFSFGAVGYLLEKAAGLMGFSGPEGGFSNTGRTVAAMNDGAVLKDGQVTTFHDNDTLLAGKPGGGLAGALSQLMGTAIPINMASGAAGAMGSTFLGKKAAQGFGILDMVKNMALKSLFGPLLKDSITDPIVQALGGDTGDGTGGINVTVYIGQEEVDATVVKAINSPQGRAAILPWSPGAPR
tara:strand:+ start:1076 stop:3598 length:2523 start_codon:yes stop_codon:yes gene_type:complete